MGDRPSDDRGWRLDGGSSIFFSSRSGSATTAYAECLRWAIVQEMSWRTSRAMLSEVLNWFSEGFDTADLKDAKALLRELSA